MTGCLSETSEDYSGRRGVTSNIPTQNTGRGGQFGNRYQKSEWNKMWRETIRGGVFIKQPDRGARKRNSGKYLRLVDFGQVVQTMVCREVFTDETGFLIIKKLRYEEERILRIRTANLPKEALGDVRYIRGRNRQMLR